MVFRWNEKDYRIRPEPREFHVLMVENSTAVPSLINVDEEYLKQFPNGGEIIKVIEVLDD